METKPSVTNGELNALNDLKRDTSIIIKKADKSNIIVIMDTEFYKNKLVLTDYLNNNNYEKADVNADKKVFQDLKSYIELNKSCLTSKELNYITKYEWRWSNFYIQPKINKCKTLKDIIITSNSEYIKTDPPESLKGRPIVAGPESPTKHLCQLIDRILSPIVPCQVSYIKDDWDFVRKLPKQVAPNSKLISCDIVSL